MARIFIIAKALKARVDLRSNLALSETTNRLFSSLQVSYASRATGKLQYGRLAEES